MKTAVASWAPSLNIIIIIIIVYNFKTRLKARGYPKRLIERMISEVSFAGGSRHSKNKPSKLRAKLCLLWRHIIQGKKT